MKPVEMQFNVARDLKEGLLKAKRETEAIELLQSLGYTVTPPDQVGGAYDQDITVNHVGSVHGQGPKGSTVIVFYGALTRDKFPKAGDRVQFISPAAPEPAFPLPGNYDAAISETARDLGINEDLLRAGRDVALLTPEQGAD